MIKEKQFKTANIVQPPHFSVGKLQVQQREVACPRPQGQWLKYRGEARKESLLTLPSTLSFMPTSMALVDVLFLPQVDPL